MSVVAQRLRDARKRAGLTQEQLGVQAGIEEASASARMSQYEKGLHTPPYQMMERFAGCLDVPVEYFYASSEEAVVLLLNFHRLTPGSQKSVLSYLQDLVANELKS